MSWALGIIQQERRGRMISSGCVVKEINCFDFLGLNEAFGGCCKVQNCFGVNSYILTTFIFEVPFNFDFDLILGSFCFIGAQMGNFWVGVRCNNSF